MTTENLNYYNSGIEEYKSFIEYATGLTFKDSVLAQKTETDRATINANNYISARLSLTEPSSKNLVNTFHQLTIDVYNGTHAGGDNYLYEVNPYYQKLFVERNVDLLVVRTAADFDIIGEGATTLSDAYRNLFKTEYTKNLVYFKKTMYTDGFGGNANSEYRSFVKFFVAWMTIQSTLDSLKGPNGLNVELMDKWTVTNMLYSYGITFLDDLSVSHQRLIVTNLVDLFNKKGSSSVFATIFKIFGFDNMEAFRYFLVKGYEKDENDITDYTKPDISFLKVPYDEPDFEKYIGSLTESQLTAITEDFDKIVQDDPTWKATKDEVSKQEFNYIQSKYFDLQSAVDMYKHSTNMTFLYELINTIKYERAGDNFLTFYANDISAQPIDVFDCLIAMHILTMEILGYDASIPTKPSSFRTIYGFRHEKIFLSEMSDTFISTFADSNFITLDQLSVNLDSNEIVKLLDTNFALKDKLEKIIESETDYDKYTDILNDYKVLYLSNTFKEAFNGDTEYLAYIRTKNEGLYDFLVRATTNTTENDKRTALNSLSIAIENYFNSDYVLPTHLNTDYTLGYIKKLINNFKAYTVELNEVNILFTVNSPFEKLKFFDKIREYVATNSFAECLTLISKVVPSLAISLSDHEYLFKSNCDRISMSEISSIMVDTGFMTDDIQLPTVKLVADNASLYIDDSLVHNTDISNNELVNFKEHIVFQITE